MEVDLNKLIGHFVSNHFMVQGVYYSNVKAGSKGFEISSPTPGFIFPLKGRSQYSFNKTPCISRLESIIHVRVYMDY